MGYVRLDTFAGYLGIFERLEHYSVAVDVLDTLTNVTNADNLIVAIRQVGADTGNDRFLELFSGTAADDEEEGLLVPLFRPGPRGVGFGEDPGCKP